MTPERLQRLIDHSGLSARRFAMDVLSRDERTVRRWLAGEPIPAAAEAWLLRLERVELTAKERVRIVVRLE